MGTVSPLISMKMPSRVSEPPSGASDKVKAACLAATEALSTAEALEEQARKARRQANSRIKHYEDLLLECNGQLELPLGEWS